MPPAYRGRFTSEARTSLPMIGHVDAGPAFDSIWTGLQYQRIRLKTDRQLVEWHGISV